MITAAYVFVTICGVVSCLLLGAIAIPMMIDTRRMIRETTRILDHLPVEQRAEDRRLGRYCTWLHEHIPGL